MGISGFQVLTVTDAAAGRVRDIVAATDAPVEGIRVGIKKGGCAGMEYTVDLVSEANSADDRIDLDGVTVFVDPAATLFLLGTQMDYEVTKLRSGFVFKNPNQTSACGCGESVELKKADLAAMQAASGS